MEKPEQPETSGEEADVKTTDLNAPTEKTKDFVEGSTFEKLNLNKWLIDQCKIVG